MSLLAKNKGCRLENVADGKYRLEKDIGEDLGF